jgi:cyclophilin family peptidyl-prolyl cis-trans isomerase
MKRTYGGWGARMALGVCLVVLAANCGCGKSEPPPAANAGGQARQAAAPPAPAAAGQPQPAAAQQPEPAPVIPQTGLVARMDTSMGTIVLQLAEAEAPNTVANFVHLASKGFYNGVIFHRAAAGFVIQSGDPEGTGRGGPGWSIPDEFHPKLRHSGPGVLSMANRGPNTGGSQFFIALRAAPELDGRHAVFGRVVGGMDVVNAIGALPTDMDEKPLRPPTISRIVLLRDGVELTGVQPEPKTMPARQRRSL